MAENESAHIINLQEWKAANAATYTSSLPSQSFGEIIQISRWRKTPTPLYAGREVTVHPKGQEYRSWNIPDFTEFFDIDKTYHHGEPVQSYIHRYTVLPTKERIIKIGTLESGLFSARNTAIEESERNGNNHDALFQQLFTATLERAEQLSSEEVPYVREELRTVVRYAIARRYGEGEAERIMSNVNSLELGRRPSTLSPDRGKLIKFPGNKK